MPPRRFDLPSGEPDRLYREILAGCPDRLEALDARQRHSLFQELAHHPVASLDSLPRYDPTGELGFCFGRAVAAHLMARQMGLREASVGKMFMVGELSDGTSTAWRFHVTTVVRGGDGAWYAIDPILPRPVSAAGWIRAVRRMWDPAARARVYLTPASCVMPDVRHLPDVSEETGQQLIELAFRPEGKPGFEELPALGAFQVEPEAGRRYFLEPEEGPEERFDFEGITINGRRFGYNRYFTELLADLRGPKTRPAPAPSWPHALAASLYSPRWGAGGTVR